MRYLDISLSIEPGMPAYVDDPAVGMTPWSSRATGAEFNLTALRLGSHTGTHVDAPAHCLDGGAPVDSLPLDLLCGPAFVLDLTCSLNDRGHATIAADALVGIPAGCERLLLRTHAGEHWRSGAATASGLTSGAASGLVERGIRLVGIDRLSVAVPEAELAVHQLLLGGGLVIVEGLDLSRIAQGDYQLICLPLKLAGVDGAPARAVLLEA